MMQLLSMLKKCTGSIYVLLITSDSTTRFNIVLAFKYDIYLKRHYGLNRHIEHVMNVYQTLKIGKSQCSQITINMCLNTSCLNSVQFLFNQFRLSGLLVLERCWLNND